MATFRIRPAVRNNDPTPHTRRSPTVRFGARWRGRRSTISCCLSRRFSATTVRTPRPFYLVQPWGHDRYRQATVQSTHDTVYDAYARLDAIAEKLQRDGAPPDYLELYVVDEQRQPVTRPGVQ